MDNKELEILDKIINVSFINLYTLSKLNHTLRFSDIDLNNEKHKALIYIMTIYCEVIDPVDIYLSMPLFQFWKLKLKVKNKNFKRINHKTDMTFNDFISHLENANKDLITDPFSKIAQCYLRKE